MNELRTQDNNLFYIGLNKDEDIQFLKEGEYTHAVNATTYTHTGERNCLSNEPSTIECTDLPFTLIGSVPMEDRTHCMFTTDGVNSEIGVFDEAACTYTKIIRSRCLGFSKNYLVKGVFRKNFACERMVYWNDGLNPSRVLNLDSVPYKFALKEGKGCPEKIYTSELDCVALLMSPLITVPFCTVKEAIGGSLPNGSYRAAIAYSINQIRVTDYLYISDIESLFSKQNLGKSIEVKVSDLDSDFDEYQLVLISNIDMQTTAEVVGYYSTSQKSIYIGSAREQGRETIALSELVNLTPTYWKAEDMAVVNETLLQFRVTTKPDLDYQKQANKIVTRSVAYKVPSDYYRKGGNKVGYMRDENYALFIRWIDKGGKPSSWFHIPGRPALAGEDKPYSSKDAYEALLGSGKRIMKLYEVVNTADYININNFTDVKEEILGMGKLGYHESTEEYPNTPIYASNGCKPIRHHKMPDAEKVPLYSNATNRSMIILGLQFDKIEHPKDANGNIIEDIQSFEIGRGSRKGNMTVLAKGMVHNAGAYKDPLNNDQLTIYRNYPHNDLRVDPYLSRTEVKGGTQQHGYSKFGTFRNDIFTFHSPTVQHKKINLGQELKIEGEVYGDSKGSFQEVYKHPKHKLIRDFALLVAGLVGVAEGLLAIKGQKCNTISKGYLASTTVAAGATTSVPTDPATVLSAKTSYGLDAAKETFADALGIAQAEAIAHNSASAYAKQAARTPLGATPGSVGPHTEETTCASVISFLPLPIRLASSVFIFAYYFGFGTEKALDIVKKLVPFQQYALQYNSHAFYDKFQEVTEGSKRRAIENFIYSNSSTGQTFAGTKEAFLINNVDRPTTLFIKLSESLVAPKVIDNTRVLASKIGVNKTGVTQATGYYAAVKTPNPAQYGQINSIEVEHTSYVQPVDFTKLKEGETYTTDVVFGGDTYIGRYTEKNIMPFFTQFLYDLKDGFELDYTRYPNIAYPRFWINTQEYDVSEIVKIPPSLPNDKHSLDNNTGSGSKGTFVIKNGYFYLFCNGVMDFFCESEINVDYRNWGTQLWEKHYDPHEYTNTSLLFRSDIITRDNEFRYDASLSKSEQLNFTNGVIQPQDFSPSECFTFYKNRIIYSLPQQKDLKKDNWRTFLANNYYDFGTTSGTLSTVKPINKTGALFLFENGSPMMFQGVDSLNTDLGTKVTLGDGGLFAQQPQSVVQSDYALGASSSRWATLSTEFGLFFVSESQGKVFNFTGQLEEISMYGMSAWFREYLPLNLVKHIPNYPYKDNIVAGVGFHMVFDNNCKLLYLTKKDYVPKVPMTWDGQLKTGRGFVAELGDPAFFDDASWTISYNPMTKRWVSFHDWHPQWLLQTQTTPVSVFHQTLWRHNLSKDSYCRFYKQDYPFEVEVPVKDMVVNTLSSLEYNLESYVHKGNDYFHVLEWNFDEAIVYNSEQISGVHRLNASQKKGIYTDSLYPFVKQDHFESLYSKVEQKFRLNQFWDIVANRGEFNDIQRTLWLSSPNGYKRSVNPLAVNYFKKMIERKPFRHYWNKLILRRRINEDKNMLFKWLVSKKINSPR